MSFNWRRAGFFVFWILELFFLGKVLRRPRQADRHITKSVPEEPTQQEKGKRDGGHHLGDPLSSATKLCTSWLLRPSSGSGGQGSREESKIGHIAAEGKISKKLTWANGLRLRGNVGAIAMEAEREHNRQFVMAVCILSGVNRSRERFSETYLHKMCIVVSIGGRGLGHSRGSTRPISDPPLPTYGIAFRTIGGQCFLVWKSPTKSLKHNTKLNLSEMYLSHKITLVNVCAYFWSRKVLATLSYRA